MNDTQRLFVALWPTEDVRRSIVSATQEAVKEARGLAIPPQNFHVTLAFLGKVAIERLASIQHCIEALRFDPFTLTMNEVRVWKHNAVLCLEPRLCPALNALVDRLRRELSSIGFDIESRAFRAHVTLAREVRAEPRNDRWISDIIWPVDRNELVESTLTETGSIYRLVSP